MAGDRPTGAFVLSIMGGIVIIIAGLITGAIGAVFTFFAGGTGGVFGLIGAFWGMLIIALRPCPT